MFRGSARCPECGIRGDRSTSEREKKRERNGVVCICVCVCVRVYMYGARTAFACMRLVRVRSRAFRTRFRDFGIPARVTAKDRAVPARVRVPPYCRNCAADRLGSRVESREGRARPTDRPIDLDSVAPLSTPLELTADGRRSALSRSSRHSKSFFFPSSSLSPVAHLLSLVATLVLAIWISRGSDKIPLLTYNSCIVNVLIYFRRYTYCTHSIPSHVLHLSPDVL